MVVRIVPMFDDPAEREKENEAVDSLCDIDAAGLPRDCRG
jgi:hypothetical protein